MRERCDESGRGDARCGASCFKPPHERVACAPHERAATRWRTVAGLALSRRRMDQACGRERIADVHANTEAEGVTRSGVNSTPRPRRGFSTAVQSSESTRTIWAQSVRRCVNILGFHDARDEV